MKIKWVKVGPYIHEDGDGTLYFAQHPKGRLVFTGSLGGGPPRAGFEDGYDKNDIDRRAKELAGHNKDVWQNIKDLVEKRETWITLQLRVEAWRCRITAAAQRQ